VAKIVPRPNPKKILKLKKSLKNFALLVEQINQTRAPETLLLMAADEGKFGRIGEVRSVGVLKASADCAEATGQTVCLRLCCCAPALVK